MTSTLPSLTNAKITNRASYGKIEFDTRNGKLIYSFVAYWDGIDDNYQLEQGNADGLTDDELNHIDETIKEYFNHL